MTGCCAPVSDGCVAFFEQDWVRALAGEQFHPGGAELSRRTAMSLNLPPGSRVLDLACGCGTTAFLLAREFGFEVTGIDVGAGNIALARARARTAAVRFEHADAHRLPFADATFDGVLAECAFSLFADPAAALGEVRRVLRPAGVVGLTDMGIGGPLPEDLLERTADWSCLREARSQPGYEALFEGAGYQVLRSVDESASLTALLRQLKLKLMVLGTGALLAKALPPQLSLATVSYWLGRFADEVQRGHIRYLRFLLR